MDNGLFNIFNEAFLFLSCLGLIASVILYVRLKNKFSLFVRISLVFGFLLSIVASMLPRLATVLTVAFIPPFMYHMFDPLTIAPFVIVPIGFVGTWALLTLAHEFFDFIHREVKPPQTRMTLFALLLFTIMGYQITTGLIDYKVIFNREKILNYATNGSDPHQLEKTYTEVALSHDSKLFDELLSVLALNRNTSPELLRVIYARTADSDLETTRRNYIFVALSKNPHTSSDLLKKLMLSISQVSIAPTSAANLSSASRNPNFSQDTLLQLAAYPDCEIRRAIISYPNIPENVLNRMIENDPDLGVRHDAKRRLEFLHGISHLGVDSRAPVNPANKNIEPTNNIVDLNKLEKIYANIDSEEDPDEVLENLASNCYITEQLAREIYSKGVAKRGYARTAVLMALSVNPKTPEDILERLAAEKDLAILRELASNPNIPYGVISRFAPFPDCKIRKEIICIPNASKDILKQLRADADESVALEATERLRQEGSYLDICREMKNINSSCQKFYGSPVQPKMRLYPNTSEAKPRDQPVALQAVKDSA